VFARKLLGERTPASALTPQMIEALFEEATTLTLCATFECKQQSQLVF
jgi:hypothetical protein